ncbi:MAG: SctK family type III secretion system sorting platform protein [Puniceicoccales bacterium]|jgi:hypothetical protein|nr:SctK family type III secretion system sorting platform protein [Puniceicoccales bacterium]
MNETNANALKKILKTNFTLFRQWYDFHYGIDSYVDKSLYDNVVSKYSSKAFDIMFASASRRADLKREILHQYGLSEKVNYQVDSPVLPFAMLKSETLSKLQPIAGAMVCFKDVNKVIARRELSGIFELVGKDVYTFVVKRSLVFWKKIPSLKKDFPRIRLGDRIPMCGKLVLEYAISSLPESVLRRMSMRSGIDFDHLDGCSQEDVTKAIELIKYVLVNFFKDSEDAKLCLK